MDRDADPGHDARSDDRTGRWLLTAVLLAVAALVAVAAGLGGLHRAARDRLDDALGQRLVDVARTTARLVDGDSLRVWSYDPQETLEYIWLRRELGDVRVSNGLAEISLCDVDGFVMVSAVKRHERGDFNAFWDVDPDAVAAARSGIPAATALYREGDVWQKTAYAPVHDIEGVVTGVIGVEAEADFFDALSTQQRGAWLTGTAVLVVLTVLLVVLARLLRDIVRYRASLVEQEKLASMGRMTAGIAHEIRNPLGILRGAGESLQLRLERQGEDPALARVVIDEVDRLDGVLRRYLTFGRGGGLEPEPADLEHLVRSAVRNLRAELADVGVEATVDVTGQARTVHVDVPAFQQVLLNLVLNARDAAAGRDPARVEIRLDHRDDVVRLSVADTGAGLEGRDPEELFTPFRTTKEKGSGLGLAVVRQVAEDHGGGVALRDRDDGPGAVAVVTLPYDSPKEGS